MFLVFLNCLYRYWSNVVIQISAFYWIVYSMMPLSYGWLRSCTKWSMWSPTFNLYDRKTVREYLPSLRNRLKLLWASILLISKPRVLLQIMMVIFSWYFRKKNVLMGLLNCCGLEGWNFDCVVLWCVYMYDDKQYSSFSGSFPI